MSNTYIDNLMEELKSDGIVPPTSNNSITHVDDKELQVILDMERLTGTEYSEEQKKILRHKGNACILACAGSGKALVNGTKILTTKGKVPIEDLKVGDTVFDENGNTQQVLGVYPQGYKDVFTVYFSGDKKERCCKDHLWTCIVNNNTVTIKTKELMYLVKNSKNLISIPVFNGSILDNNRREYYNQLLDSIGTSDILGISIHEFINSCGCILNTTEEINFIPKTKNEEEINSIKKILEFLGCSVYTELTDDGIYTISAIHGRNIICIEEENYQKEMTCIKVSGESELFLTENCIATHNTTISTHLIAKRIKTGEIGDTNKLVYMTYNKASALEMEDRLHALLKKLNIDRNISVKTIHAFFLHIIRLFGVTANIIPDDKRNKFIKNACKDASLDLQDDDLSVLNNLLSYQVNNLLSDAKTIESPANTLDNMTLEQYSTVRRGYAQQKNQERLIDYDDMQSYLYLWLVKFSMSDNPDEVELAKKVREYCKAMWTDFYIDEAQDVCKIQFAIIRAMVEDPDNKGKLDRNLVFIGDDDQCLIEGTKVITNNDIKNIEDIQIYDYVLSGVGHSDTAYKPVTNISKKYVNANIVEIHTKSGKIVRGTDNHIGYISKYMCDNNIYLEIDEDAKFTENKYKPMPFGNINIGMLIPVVEKFDDEYKVIDDEIIEIKRVQYSGYVYDLEVDETHNFTANNIIVHNCIYQWRGSDPSIILSVGPIFNIPTFVLSTNYRCYNEIVDYATTGIKCNKNRYAKDMKAYQNGGVVKILQSKQKDLCSLSVYALNHIKYLLSQGNNKKDIAVLSRNNLHLTILSNMLLREGIYCDMSNDMKFTKSSIYKDIKSIINLCNDSRQKSITVDILWKLCSYLGRAATNAIANFQDESGLPLVDNLGWIIKNFIDRNCSFNKTINVPNQVISKLQTYINRLGTETRSDLILIYTILSYDNKEERIKSLLNMYINRNKSFLHKTADIQRTASGMASYIIMLIQKDGLERTLDFLRITEQLEYGNMVINDEKVTLSTIHSAKGREWKNVIMFACDNISEPNLQYIETMKYEGIPLKSINDYIDEERRLFYVGNTRAKQNLFIITYDEPSIFILEALGKFNDISYNNNIIMKLAQSNTIVEDYEDFIEDNISNPNSKYHYTQEN